ncbi:lysostaphin resistance A-like protein [Clostridium sp. Mt-5]|uniref:Lysostaphin resistance A-like protein n=1 Tax=Clostridium moutaii TaxID=3240932 RepID=A0ABV4BR41_9CLOT
MTKDKKSLTYVFFTLILASVLWYLLFIVKPFNFWIQMSVSILILIIISSFSKNIVFKFKKITPSDILLGILSAIVLYAIFYFGNIISGYLFSFKDTEILSVYNNKAQGDLKLISALLLFLIGPGEEIYWRGFIQSTLAKILGENKGYVLSALLYSLVHVITGNFMLVLAALVCGLYWGWLYKKRQSLIPVIISHALWDFTIFVLFPLI